MIMNIFDDLTLIIVCYRSEELIKKFYNDQSTEQKLAETKIIDSSGSLEIDKIAQEIVKLASPFEPFSDEMISEYEVLQVDRIWKFGS